MGNLYGHKNIKEKFYGRNLRAANGRRTLFQDFTTGLHEPFPTLGGEKRFARARCSFLRRRGNDASSLLQRRVFENVNL